MGAFSVTSKGVDQGVHDDPRLAAVHDVVGIVTQVRAFAVPSFHGR